MTPFTTIAYVKAFENRCNIMGWNTGAQNITKFLNQANITIDIVKNYRQIAEEVLKLGCDLLQGRRCTFSGACNSKQPRDGSMPP